MEPLYIRIAKQVEMQIDNAIYTPGTKIPAEQELIKTYNVSRITVRQAINLLETKGIVKRRQGMGTFVIKPVITQTIDDIVQIYPSMIIQGITPGYEILDYNLINPQPEIRRYFGLSKNEQVLNFKRRISINNAILSLCDVFIPENIANNWTKEEASVKPSFCLLQKNASINLGNTQIKIRASLAKKEIAQWLKVSKNSPVLELKRLRNSIDNIPVEYSVMYFNAAFYELSTNITQGSILVSEKNQPFSHT